VPFFLCLVNKCFVCLCRGGGMGVFMHDSERMGILCHEEHVHDQVLLVIDLRML